MQQKLISTVESTAKLDQDAASIQYGLNTRAYRAASKASGIQQKVTFGTTEEGPLQTAQRQLKQEIKQLSRTLDGQVKEVMAPVTQKYSDDMVQLYKKRAGNLSQQLQNNRLYYNQDSNGQIAARRPDPIMKQVELEESVQEYKNKLQQALVDVATLTTKCEKQQEIVDNLNSLIKEVYTQNQIKAKKTEELEKTISEQQQQLDSLQLLSLQQKETIDAQTQELKTIKEANSNLINQNTANQREIKDITNKINAVQTKYRDRKSEIKKYQELNFQLQQQITQLSTKILQFSQFSNNQDVIQPQVESFRSQPESNCQMIEQDYKTQQNNSETQNELQTKQQICTQETQENNDFKLHLYKRASQIFEQEKNNKVNAETYIQLDQQIDNQAIEQQDEGLLTLTQTNDVMQQTSAISTSSTSVLDQIIGSSKSMTQQEEIGVETEIVQNESFGVQVEVIELPVEQDNVEIDQQQSQDDSNQVEPSMEYNENPIESIQQQQLENEQIDSQTKERINTEEKQEVEQHEEYTKEVSNHQEECLEQ